MNKHGTGQAPRDTGFPRVLRCEHTRTSGMPLIALAPSEALVAEIRRALPEPATHFPAPGCVDAAARARAQLLCVMRLRKAPRRAATWCRRGGAG